MRTQHTLVEILVIGGFFLFVLLWITGPLLIRSRSADMPALRRAACAQSCTDMIRACHLYADVVTNLGQFPLYAESHNNNAQKAMAKLFDAYVKDHRVFSCANKATATGGLVRYQPPDESTLQTGYTNHGYDPGHNPTHTSAGILGDMGTLHATNGNSTNHGSDGWGQNVALGSGAVEWFDTPYRQVKTVTCRPTTDHIFKDDISADLPEELETCILR
jgi:hypothetical protein